MLTLNFDTISFAGNMSLALIGLFPFFLNLKYFNQFKLVDYLLLVLYFSYWGPFLLIFESTGSYFYSTSVFPYANLWNEPLFLVAFTSICECVPIYLIAIRSKWVYPPVWSYLIATFPFILTILVVFDNENTSINGYNSLYLALFISRIIFYGISSYIFFNTKLICPTKRAIYAKYIWVIASVSMTITMLIFSIGSVVLGIQPSNEDPYSFTMTFLALGFANIAFFLFIILHLFFPEAILLTDEQMRNAKKIYKVMYLMKQRENVITNIGISTLKNYIKEIPPEWLK